MPASPVAGSPPIPTLPAPGTPQPPALPGSAIPPVQRTIIPKQTNPADSGNSFERLAGLVIDHAADQAKRLAQNLNEAPAGARELSPEDVKARWYYSPTGSTAKADALFWQVHDQVLAQTGNHSQAETQAMQAAYPKRLQLAQIGMADADRQVQLAEDARKLVDGDQAPDSATVAADHAAHATRVRQSGGYV
jgi:hypothetical protein